MVSCKNNNIAKEGKSGGLYGSFFHPIALTLVVAKLFQKILANRLEVFLTCNSIINNSLQKWFLRGVNGCIEHVLSIQAIIDNAHKYHHPLTLCFINLKNVFGSIAHSYTHDMFRFINLPPEFTNCLQSELNLISPCHTKDWKTC